MLKPNMTFDPIVSGSKRGGSLSLGIGSLSYGNIELVMAMQYMIIGDDTFFQIRL